jgi:hypothetical protein
MEEENFLKIELEMIKILFSDEQYLNFLKEEKFDIGIGGLSFSDALLFRELDIPYIRLSEEDIETYAM